MIIQICVGSSCHLKGSYDVLEQMKSIVKKYNVEDVVTLQASFCLGDCAEGVTVRSESGEGAEQQVVMLHHVNAENAEQLFVEQVYPLLNC